MFRVFQYFIYQVNGSLQHFDPTQDMPITKRRYLTYRRFDQVVPTGATLYAGVIKDRSDAEWMIWRFNNGLYQPGVGEWLEHLSYGSTSIGPWDASRFTGVFAATPERAIGESAIYWHKIQKMEEFFRLYLNGQKAPFKGGHGPVDKKRWQSVVDWLLPSIVDARGQLLKSDSTVAI
jgi:hypothetical protein